MVLKVLFDTKQKIHFIARVIKKPATEWNSMNFDGTSALNSLLLTKSPEQLMSFVETMPSLFPEGRLNSTRQVFSFADAKTLLPKRFRTLDESRLEGELFLEAAKPLWANRCKISSFAEKFSSKGDKFCECLNEYDEGEYVVLLEHLQDWLMLRNSLSLCACLLGMIGNEERPVSLVDAGFRYKENTQFESPEMYIIPFKYNTFFSKVFSGNIDTDPLFHSMVKIEMVQSTIPDIGEVGIYYLDQEREDVFFLTKPVATQEYDSNIKVLFHMDKKPVEEMTFYLCVQTKKERSQEELAKNVVSAFTYAFRNLTEKEEDGTRLKNGRALGWEYDDLGEFKGLSAPRIVSGSLASELFYRLIYHPGKTMTVCGYCGNGVLSSEQGMHKEYCSDSCRVQAVKKRRMEAEDA